MIPALFSRVGGIGFPEDVLNKRALWLLGQRRHLVAHRCGIVDREYLDKAKDDRQEEGHPLKLRGRDIAESLGAAASYAILLYGNARYCWKQDG